jgi:hypothetical protein
MLWRLIHKWHKRIGIVSALFVIALTLTGIMLNHTEVLGMQDNYVQNQLLLNTYNIGPKQEPHGFQVNDHWVTKVGERVYFNQQDLTGSTTRLIGVVSIDDYFVIALDEYLLLVTSSGEIIERLTGSEGVPSGMQAIGKSISGSVIIRGAHGDYYADFENTNWHEEDEIEAVWSEANVIPDDIKKDLLERYRGTGLSLERVILDIHSGRIIGNWGVYLVDFMAILFFLLALSGTWMWFKQN